MKYCFELFQISELQSIRIVIDGQNKRNIYGYKSKGLHVFDEVVVEYVNDNYVCVLATDIVRHVVEVFANTLKKALEKKLQLDAFLEVGKVGCAFSQEKMYMSPNGSGKENDIFSEYWVWSSSKSIQTWLYNKNDKIYLEISQTYPWIFSEPEEDEYTSYVSFDEYLATYWPILKVELSEPLVQIWINQCCKLLQTMEKV